MPDGRLVEQSMEGKGGRSEEAVGEEPVEGQDLHLHLLVAVDRRRDRPWQALQGKSQVGDNILAKPLGITLIILKLLWKIRLEASLILFRILIVLIPYLIP